MKAYVVWTNEDLTEGRGAQVPIAVCLFLSTARRLAKKEGVQGFDADIYETTVEWIPGEYSKPGYYQGPINLIKGTLEDIQTEAELQRNLKKTEAKEALLERIKKAGFNDEEIELLK